MILLCIRTERLNLVRRVCSLGPEGTPVGEHEPNYKVALQAQNEGGLTDRQNIFSVEKGPILEINKLVYLQNDSHRLTQAKFRGV